MGLSKGGGRGNLGIREYRYEVACHGRAISKEAFSEIFFLIFWQCLLSPIAVIQMGENGVNRTAAFGQEQPFTSVLPNIYIRHHQ